MEKIRGKYLILNGNEADPSAYQPGRSASLFYEVMRVNKERILFVEDHLDRLENSCRLSGHSCTERNLIREQLFKLVQLNALPEGNIKLVVFEEKGELQTACFFIAHKYPSAEEKIHGVNCLSFPFERPDPNVKKWNETFRGKVNAFIKDHSIYEAILVNNQGFITEGSRSNIFFVSTDDILYTAPGEVILPGITRHYVLDICKNLGIPVKETMLSLKAIAEMKSCFISGTSPGVLPVKELDNARFSVGDDVLSSIIREYGILVGV